MGLSQELGDPDPPVDAFLMAEACGLRVQFAPMRTARLVSNVVLVSQSARRERQHGLVAHELGHFALMRAGEQDTEVAASYVAGAIMLPRRHFDADLRRTSWDIAQLRAKHVNCSAELIARRIVTLRDACVSVWDNGRLKVRVASPWLPSALARLSAFERCLAADVLDRGETIREDELLWGFAVFDGPWRRVITVCEAEQLALRY